MFKQWETEVKVGVFIASGALLIMLAIVLLGGVNSFFSKQNKYLIYSPSAEGLINGSKVVLGGLNVGTVRNVDFDHVRQDIKVELLIGKKYEEWIRKDSVAEILTQGVLGDKYVSIYPGTATSEPLPDLSEITLKPTPGLTQFFSKGDQLLISLNGIATNLEKLLKSFQSENRSEIIFSSMATTSKNLATASHKLATELDQIQIKNSFKNLNSILEKINNGTGTLGALVNDPGLYYDAKALMGGANRNRVIRNLVRKTIKDKEETTAK